jgi:hypothetical protein
MNAYDACCCCSRYVKRGDTRCPFCGAATRPAPRSEASHRRMSRGQWLVYASAFAVIGCGSDTAATAESVNASWPTGTFPCGSIASMASGGLNCDRRTQYCSTDEPQCYAYDAGPLAAADAGAKCPCHIESFAQPCECVFFSGTASPYCSSATMRIVSGSYTCEEDDAGGITVSYHSYHSCYGSPPARLDRLARTASVARVGCNSATAVTGPRNEDA